MMAERGITPDAVTLTHGPLRQRRHRAAQGVVFIDGSEGASVQLAPCCRPDSGRPDRRATWAAARAWWCTPPTAAPGKRLFERDSERWMDVEWAEEPTRAFETGISVLVKNGKGVLAQVAAAVSSGRSRHHPHRHGPRTRRARPPNCAW